MTKDNRNAKPTTASSTRAVRVDLPLEDFQRLAHLSVDLDAAYAEVIRAALLALHDQRNAGR